RAAAGARVAPPQARHRRRRQAPLRRSVSRRARRHHSEAAPVSHTLVTIICPVAQDNVDRARALIEALGNPAVERAHTAFEAVADEPGDLAIHFASLTVFPATDGGGHLLFEFSGDGPRDSLIAALAKHLGPLVDEAYALAADRGTMPLAGYWTSHIVEVGQGFFDNAGVVFAGTPGLSVRRIRLEL